MKQPQMPDDENEDDSVLDLMTDHELEAMQILTQLLNPDMAESDDPEGPFLCAIVRANIGEFKDVAVVCRAQAGMADDTYMLPLAILMGESLQEVFDGTPFGAIKVGDFIADQIEQDHQHAWPAELTPDSLCMTCGLAYKEWSQ